MEGKDWHLYQESNSFFKKTAAHSCFPLISRDCGPPLPRWQRKHGSLAAELWGWLLDWYRKLLLLTKWINFSSHEITYVGPSILTPATWSHTPPVTVSCSNSPALQTLTGTCWDPSGTLPCLPPSCLPLSLCPPPAFEMLRGSVVGLPGGGQWINLRVVVGVTLQVFGAQVSHAGRGQREAGWESDLGQAPKDVLYKELAMQGHQEQIKDGH